MEINKNNYHKIYYESNKQKLREQQKKRNEKIEIDKLLNNLNNNFYKRKPILKLKKYNIKFDDETKKYFV